MYTGGDTAVAELVGHAPSALITSLSASPIDMRKRTLVPDSLQDPPIKHDQTIEANEPGATMLLALPGVCKLRFRPSSALSRE